jgi:signal peptidase I
MALSSDQPVVAVPDSGPPRSNRLRSVIEMGVSLVVLVSLFRSFLAGGYMIETGSMAPCLLGYHRQAVCPSCRFSFAIEGNSRAIKATCPNCGRSGISVDRLSRNDGDHLLVHRGLYEFRSPRRWEVVVFRNPNKLTQAYVKRLIALPGETVQIVDGDVYIGGEIQSKDYATQCGIRIPVFDNDFRPDDEESGWRPHWIVAQPGQGWKETGGAFEFSPSEVRNGAEIAWVNYRHWVRHGGAHVKNEPLTRWPESLDRPVAGFGPLTVDEDAGTLSCRGAMPRALRDELLAEAHDAGFSETVARLFDASHVAPITDTYGYNRGPDGQGTHAVRDLMLSAEVEFHEGPGEFVVAMSDGTEEVQGVFDLAERKVRLKDTRTGRAMRTAPLNDEWEQGPVKVELSLMDRQALLAVAGRPVFKPWSYSASSQAAPTRQRPVQVRFGAKGAGATVSSLKLFRDVYYTDDSGHRAVDAPVTLKPDEYFVLGDNSPVSRDSRSWSERTHLTREMFLGKPMVVHLPSRSQRIRLGSWQTEIRIPEISRVRYIR